MESLRRLPSVRLLSHRWQGYLCFVLVCLSLTDVSSALASTRPSSLPLTVQLFQMSSYYNFLAMFAAIQIIKSVCIRTPLMSTLHAQWAPARFYVDVMADTIASNLTIKLFPDVSQLGQPYVNNNCRVWYFQKLWTMDESLQRYCQNKTDVFKNLYSSKHS